MSPGLGRSAVSAVAFAPLQGALPEFLMDLVGIAGTLVLVLMVVAIVGMVYKHLTGGIEWPDDKKEDDDEVSRGSQDDEWDYY